MGHIKLTRIVDNKPIYLLIDGTCLLCQSITRFVIKRDTAGRFRFAALQSPAGHWLLTQGKLPLHDFDTFVMVEGDRYFVKSEAAIRTLRRLGGLWPTLYAFILVPRLLRDWVYDQIASRRFRWFGRQDVCLVPKAEWRSRFVVEKDEVTRP